MHISVGYKMRDLICDSLRNILGEIYKDTREAGYIEEEAEQMWFAEI